jgi:hypothetical protein
MTVAPRRLRDRRGLSASSRLGSRVLRDRVQAPAKIRNGRGPTRLQIRRNLLETFVRRSGSLQTRDTLNCARLLPLGLARFANAARVAYRAGHAKNSSPVAQAAGLLFGFVLDGDEL